MLQFYVMLSKVMLSKVMLSKVMLSKALNDSKGDNLEPFHIISRVWRSIKHGFTKRPHKRC